ncbi:uncharacterized protein C7orf31-like isoform X1 [Hypomesus transpacificus]|uniref:uncharacterized protein C7orf31-like isoform X1 n=1 Tax=Hypomesus transpacificus TaxID=137520 RepID=UPI001F07E8CB|nr:uncharacterized protein C7orf31-like isoform X1 [Hypomesus transpacificus]
MVSTEIQDNYVSMGFKSFPPHPYPPSHGTSLPTLFHHLPPLRSLPEQDEQRFLRSVHQEVPPLFPDLSLPHGTPAKPLRQPTAGEDPPHSDQPPPVSLPRLASLHRRGLKHPPVSSSPNTKHPTVLVKGHFHRGYGGSTLTEVPRPTQINISEKQILVPVPREHPNQSHISRFAMFPTFRSPDDPDSGVTAATKRPLNLLIPACTSDMRVLTKTKGAALRHELMEVSKVTQRKALLWPGQHGFYQFPKSVCSKRQVFYPSLPKTLCPNATLRNLDSTLSERTANMLRNLERSHRLTCYQLQYSGCGPANPLQLDDLHEKTVGDQTPYTIQLRGGSLVPARPQNGRQARIQQGRRCLKSSHVASPCNLVNNPNNQPGSTSDIVLKHRHGSHDNCDSAYQHNSHSVHDNSIHGYHTDEYGWGLNSSVKLHRAQNFPERSGSGHSGEEQKLGCIDPVDRHNELCCDVCGFAESFCNCLSQRSNTEDIDPQSQTPCCACRHNLLPRTGSLNLGHEDPPGCLKGVDGECARVGSMEPHRERTISRAFSCIRGTLGGSRGVCGGGGLFRSKSVLMSLQDSFSRTDSHRRFHLTIQGAVPDLRDNHHTVKQYSAYFRN